MIRRLACLCGTVMLSGCTSQLEVANPFVRLSSPDEIRAETASGEHPDGKGRWVTVTAMIDRSSLRRIVRWELYAHMIVERCGTTDMTEVVPVPVIEHVRADAFADLRRMLKANPSQSSFAISGLIFARPGDFSTRQCLTLDGGAMIGPTIVAKPVLIRQAEPRPRDEPIAG